MGMVCRVRVRKVWVYVPDEPQQMNQNQLMAQYQQMLAQQLMCQQQMPMLGYQPQQQMIQVPMSLLLGGRRNG